MDARQDRVQGAAGFWFPSPRVSRCHWPLLFQNFRWCTADTWHARRLPFVGTLIKPTADRYQFIRSNTLMECSSLYFCQFGLLDIQMEVVEKRSCGNAERRIKNVALRMVKNKRITNLRFKFPLKWANHFLPLISMQFLVFQKGQSTWLWGRDFSYWINMSCLNVGRRGQCEELPAAAVYFIAVWYFKNQTNANRLGAHINWKYVVYVYFRMDVIETPVIWSPFILRPGSGCCFCCSIWLVITMQGPFGAESFEGWWGHWAGSVFDHLFKCIPKKERKKTKNKVSSSKRRPLPRGSLTFGAADIKLHFKPLSHQTLLQRLAPDLDRWVFWIVKGCKCCITVRRKRFFLYIWLRGGGKLANRASLLLFQGSTAVWAQQKLQQKLKAAWVGEKKKMQIIRPTRKGDCFCFLACFSISALPHELF